MSTAAAEIAEPATTTTAKPVDLKTRWSQHRAEHPHVRIRDASRALGVSEAELLHTDTGETVTRLAVPESKLGWGQVIEKLPSLGRVMALTRNEHCVHERKGQYREIGFFGPMGNVVGPDIDLRFFLRQWHFGFAVREMDKDGQSRESLQFFNKDGSAIHKVYLQPESDRAAFDAIVAEFAAPDQTAPLTTEALAPEPPDRPDAEIDVEAFRAGWAALQDTHEFFLLLKKHKVGRAQALRLIGPEFATPLPPRCAEALLRAASANGTPIMVFVGNPGMIQIHTGPVERIVPFGKDGEWINVLDPEFNLHLRQPAIAHAWVVKKPTRDGHVTSVELLDVHGELVAQFFGKRKPGEAELEAWRGIVAGLAAV